MPFGRCLFSVVFVRRGDAMWTNDEMRMLYAQSWLERAIPCLRILP